MEQLPTNVKINILSFIPRRIHPTSVIMRREIDACARHWNETMRFSPWMRNPYGTNEMWGAWWYESHILAPYKDKFECRECDCCGELWDDCRCTCDCGDDYKDCKARCHENQGLILRRTNELERYCDCCGELWVECQCVCSNCGGDYKDCRANCYDENENLKTDEHE